MEWLLLAGAALLIWGVVLYNRLVSDSHRVKQAWSDISVQLKLRHDLIPKLVAAVDAYASYERTLLHEVTRQRAAAERAEDPAAAAHAEALLGDGLRRMLAIAEAYPELKADRQFLQLMGQLSEVEDQIQYARRFYNGAVRNLNVRIDSFPDLLIARSFSFRPAQFFELEAAVEETRGTRQ
ncbi:MAG: LemA family protein [Gammaproteobacteria bacterium]|nr:LemA family protein [Gammaproteobacteria bacterium]MCB1872243.1 LemA family protein [Gammaproteobacteria bacterium]MCB1903709.1 LemA family protein [Gammaproteobacteria bacterium]